jgi:hypothetical protein
LQHHKNEGIKNEREILDEMSQKEKRRGKDDVSIKKGKEDNVVSINFYLIFNFSIIIMFCLMNLRFCFDGQKVIKQPYKCKVHHTNELFTMGENMVKYTQKVM